MILSACNATRADTAQSADLILPGDSRFNVFELSNSAGDHTYASPHGTVILSFLAKNSRYCRAARFTSDNTVALACRNERGWKIEAISDLPPGEGTNATIAGSGNTKEIGDAIQALMASADFLDERGVIAAAKRGWRPPVSDDEHALDARDILKRVGRIYRASESYIDTGTVQTVYTSPSRERIGETRFKTAYVAPYDFRFESHMDDFGIIELSFIVWRDQYGAKKWFSVRPDVVEDIASIERGLDAGAAISRDSSGMIPGLIFSGTKLGGDIVRLANPVRLEDAQIDGFDCFQVQGVRWPHKGPTTVWIDKKSFLIRRVFEEDEVKGTITKTTWSYEPSINGPVETDSLHFAKPTLR